MSGVTEVLTQIRAGNSEATNDLLQTVYHELRRMANKKLLQERNDHTLQATALVHEAYLKLMGATCDDWQNRAHFFGAAAEAMRRILIDHARTKKRKKRGGNEGKRVTLSDLELPHEDRSDELLALNDAIEALELLDKQKAKLVKLKFFGGISTHEAGEILGISPRTAERHWAYARVWLYRHVNEKEEL